MVIMLGVEVGRRGDRCGGYVLFEVNDVMSLWADLKRRVERA